MVSIRFAAVAGLSILAAPVHAQDSMTPMADVAFAPEAEGQAQELASLWGDRATGPAGTYLKTPGGWVAPIHAHTADYRGVVIAGVWSHWLPQEDGTEGEPLAPGSTWTQVADEPHADACLSEEPCVILILNDEPYETYLPD